MNKPSFESPAFDKARLIANLGLWGFGLAKVPMITYVGPKICRIDDDVLEMQIKHRWRNNNHLKSLYFGAFAVGADVAGGFLAYWIARKLGIKITLAFASFDAEFKRRAHGHTIFRCEEGALIRQMILQSRERGERVTRELNIQAWTEEEPAPVAVFKLGLSLKAID
ncbi:MAG: DUF4442 domain-containing protein [Gammaproteobacteria bacterium]|nr:DUF4442 domain-containing protein [Gammaproteobacteria bacterium]